jgi:type 1 glutamine amidotransferase/nicotinamidase-related amidase
MWRNLEHTRLVLILASVLFLNLDAMSASSSVETSATNGLDICVKSRDRATGEVSVSRQQLSPKQTAIIVCDMWNQHWCKGATKRSVEIADRMNVVLTKCREAGVFIIHAPSGTMDAYKDTTQRRLAIEAPTVKNLPDGIQNWLRHLPSEGDHWPIDQTDGGCDCSPKCKTGGPWTRQLDSITIAPEDAISDDGREVWTLLEKRGIDNVILMGVHTNMCVLGRPFGLRQMVKNGKNTFLARDLTDTMYNSRMAPFVPHDRGTDLVIRHIEQYVCPTILGSDLIGESPNPHVVFVIGEREYDTKTTLPQFAAKELRPRGMKCSFAHAGSEDRNRFPGIEALKQADLLVLSVRRRALPAEQLDVIQQHMNAGKPLVAIRTASHAFDTRGKHPEGHAEWPAFDADVLGGNYAGHYGSKLASTIRVSPDAATEPILRGVVPTEFPSGGSLYKARPLAESCTPLLTGHMPDQPTEPVAWLNSYHGGRVFYTSLGHSKDFDNPAFRRLLLNAVLWTLDEAIP